MNKVVEFYQAGNEHSLPTGWPARIYPFNPTNWVEGSGYLLNDGTYFAGGLTSEIVNANKSSFGISENLRFFTDGDYNDYIAANQNDYENWKVSNKNPDVRNENLKFIKYEAQRRIVAPLGYNPEETDKWTAKQINMTAGAAQIVLKIVQGTVTSGELNQLSYLQSFFSGVNAIRNYSNELEAQVNSGLNVDLENGWPSLG